MTENKNTKPEEEQETKTTSDEETSSASTKKTKDEETSSTSTKKGKKVYFKSRYAKHTLNFDGVPKIEFTPISSRDADAGGKFETFNERQIEALRNCEDFDKGVIKEVTERAVQG